jgi:preprotein translocase SecE subunit
VGKLKSYLDQGISFVQESWVELSKVHFQSARETTQATVVVVVLALLLALWLGLIDMVATRGVQRLITQ